MRATLTGVFAGAIAIVLTVGFGCGDSDAEKKGDGGPILGDGGDEGLTNPDGGPIDPGGENGGGPAILDLQCPTLAMPGGAGGIYVAAGSNGDGSKGSPFGSIAQALGAAPQGAIIWVAAGNYKENLQIPNKGITLMGGFDAAFGARTDACATTIEGNGAAAVLTAGAAVKAFTMEGFTIAKGARGLAVAGDASVNATFTILSSVFSENGRANAVGGALQFDRVNAKISRSAFRDNKAEKGGAIAHFGDANTIAIDGCMFERNAGHSDHGGALYLSPKTGTVVRSTFKANVIGKDLGYGWGAAAIVFKGGTVVPKVDFAYNVFTENVSSVGAVFVDEGASITLSHDLFFKNRAIAENGVARGAALYADGTGSPGGGSTLVADGLTMVDNSYDAQGNRVSGRGGGIYIESHSKATFTNTIMWNSGTELLAGDPTTTITVSDSISDSSCSGGAKCNIGEGVFMPTEINFVDEANNDFHEKSTAGHFSKGTWVNDDVTSPAIDKANASAAFANEPAPNGGRANLGAFGRTTEASKSP